MSNWLLTNTTYGTWLPGDPRGSVTRVRDRRPGDPQTTTRIRHNHVGEECEPSRPALRLHAANQLRGTPVHLTQAHADILITQFQETCRHRNWNLHAAAVMWNHVHLVVDLREECPDKGLADLKAYGSRAFNKTFGKLASGRWWTEKGSTRFLKDEEALHAAMDYVLHRQPNPLAIWPTSSTAENSGR